jgi:hypothetical protein
MNKAHESCDGLFASQSDPPEAFEFVEKAFHLMALFVEPPVYRRCGRAAWIRLDLRGCLEIVSDEGA